MRNGRGWSYAGFIPTITASGVPHSTGWPVWLLRQIIFIGFAGGAGGGVGDGGGAAALGAGVQPAMAIAADAARTAKTRRRMKGSGTAWGWRAWLKVNSRPAITVRADARWAQGFVHPRFVDGVRRG